MKRHAFFLPFTFLLFPVLLNAQHPLYDAIRLRPYVSPLNGGRSIANFRHDPASAGEALPILWLYADKNDKFLTDAFNDNPFIGVIPGESIILLPEMFLDAMSRAEIESRGGPSALAATHTTSGFSVGNLADGLARFLAQRTKQELSLTFFNRLRKSINQDPAMGALFPQTKRQLEIIDNEIFFFDRYIEVLRESFILDLKGLPHQSRVYLQQIDYSAQPDVQIIVEDVLELSQFLIDGKPVEYWFEFLAKEASLQDMNRIQAMPANIQKKTLDISATMRLAHLLSESLRNPDADNGQNTSIWLPRDTVRQAMRDPITLYLYLGLLWQQESAGNIAFQNGKNLRNALNLVADGSVPAQSIRRFVEAWTNSGGEVSSALEQPDLPSVRDSVQDDRVFGFFNSFFSLTEAVLELQGALFPGDDLQQAQVRNILENVRDLNSFNYNIRRRNYVYAIHNLAGVLVRLTGNGAARTELLRYGNFMASVAEARNSEEIARAIDLFALPPGSSATKKNSMFSVSINAYSGLGFGREFLRDAANTPQNSGIISLMAPVGFDVNVGFGRAGSLSFYTPIIDVGALTAFRLRNEDTVAEFPELKWENILAPGAFLVYGGPENLPIALGAGFQKGPNLRRVSDPGVLEITRASGFRFAVFVSIDIPISHLYVH